MTRSFVIFRGVFLFGAGSQKCFEKLAEQEFSRIYAQYDEKCAEYDKALAARSKLWFNAITAN